MVNSSNRPCTQSKKIYGFEIFGYWRFFSEPDAPKLVEDHFDSFFSLNYCEDQENVKKYWAPVGALRQWLEADKRTEVAAHVTPEVSRVACSVSMYLAHVW